MTGRETEVSGTIHAKISVLMPAYNEEYHINRDIMDTERMLKKLFADYEIMVIDERFKNIPG